MATTKRNDTQNQQVTDHDLLMSEDICNKLRISRRTLDEWLARREILAGVKIGHRLYWRRTDFEKWLASRFAGGK